MASGRALLAIADLLMFVALVAIIARIGTDYLDRKLTNKTLLVGLLASAGIAGLLASGIQLLFFGHGR